MKTTIHNPATRRLQPVALITDRAKRYRAQAANAQDEHRCIYCGQAKGRLDVEHVNGDESDSEPPNLGYACRPCNTRKGVVFRNAGIGVRTRQYNPADAFSATAAALAGRRAGASAKGRALPFGSFQDWLTKHLPHLPAEPTAREVKEWREAYYTGVRQRNPGGARSLGAYLNAIMVLKGQGSSMSLPEAIALIHATPPNKRSEYAREIWTRRRAHGTDKRTDVVPF